MAALRSVRADEAETLDLQRELEFARETDRLMAQARQLLAEGRKPQSGKPSAVALLQDVLQRDPQHAEAADALARIESALVARATAAAEAGEYARSERLLAEAGRVRPGSDDVQNASTRIVELRQDRAGQLAQQVTAAINSEDLDRARGLLAELEQVTVQAQDVEALRSRIEHASVYGLFTPGQRFSDPIDIGGSGPELVVIPIGAFEMGSARSEPGRRKNEGPRHRVMVERGFAIARSEITVAQFDMFVQATGYVATSKQRRRSTIYDERSGSMIERPGVDWQNDHGGESAAGNLPVMHISWTDASAYADWLSRVSAHTYRLPSEAEFEYVLRAGGESRFPWGDDRPPRVLENVTGDGDRSATKRSWNNSFASYSDGYWGAAPVRSFEANAFGVHDINGNVSEWVADCWHDGYSRAPNDASAWINRGCTERVIRGGSWASAPDQVRSAFRIGAEPETTSARVGFRVVREL
jgi:formylglycine-generating enzyme required for sulfatase activity